jgi:hypothetical protein
VRDVAQRDEVHVPVIVGDRDRRVRRSEVDADCIHASTVGDHDVIY